MANDLKISIVGTLNVGATIGEINTTLKGIEKKINALKLNVEINDKVLNTLKDFQSQMKRISDAALNTGKVIEEALMPDGTKVKRTYFDGLKGEFAETVKAAKEAAKQELTSLEQVSEGFKKTTSEVTKYNAALKEVGSTVKLTNDNGTQTRSVNLNSQGQVTGYKDTNNIAKQQQLDEQAAKEQQKLIEQMEQFRLQSLQRVQQRELEWNSSQQKAIQRNGDLERQEIARTQSSRQQYENWWSQAISNRELQNRNLQQSLLSQANNLLGSGSSKLDYSGVNNLAESIKNVDTASATANRDLTQMQNQLRGYSNQVNHAHESTLTFGESLKQAFSGLALWSATATILYTPIRALQDMTQRLIQIDSQMTEINRILGGMDQLKLNDLLQTAIDESDQLKNKLSDTLNIMAEFSTMGYKSEDLGNLSKVAEIMTNISGLDAKSAVDSLVSAMVNFNIQTKDAMSIEDKFSKVDQNFAVTTLDLAQGIQKAGASAKTFGVDIDSLNGYITAIAQSTRESGSVIGKYIADIKSLLIGLEVLA